MAKRRYAQIKDIIQNCELAIADIEALLKLDLNDPINKRALIRKIADLGEALTFFREDNPLLAEIQADEKKLVRTFTRSRNELLHQYIIEHHEGNERLFIEAVKNTQANLEGLKNALASIKAKPEVIANAKCEKMINAPPDDVSKYNAYDYASLAYQEIRELYLILLSLITF